MPEQRPLSPLTPSGHPSPTEDREGYVGRRPQAGPWPQTPGPAGPRPTSHVPRGWLCWLHVLTLAPPSQVPIRYSSASSALAPLPLCRCLCLCSPFRPRPHPRRPLRPSPSPPTCRHRPVRAAGFWHAPCWRRAARCSPRSPSANAIALLLKKQHSATMEEAADRNADQPRGGGDGGRRHGWDVSPFFRACLKAPFTGLRKQQPAAAQPLKKYIS